MKVMKMLTQLIKPPTQLINLQWGFQMQNGCMVSPFFASFYGILIV